MGLFFKDEKPKDEKPKEEKQESAVKTPTITNVIGNLGIVDNKFIAMLQDVIAQNNIPGQDYFEFKQAIDAMANLAIDDKSKFVTANSIFAAQGCDKNVLLTSLDKYISIVQNEQISFDAELEKQYETRVKSKLKQVDDAKLELEKLNAKIIELNSFVLKVSQEAQQEDGELKNTAANFKKSCDVVLNNLLTDKEKINNYIQ